MKNSYFGRKHHDPLIILASISPLFLRSRSLFLTYSALPSSSFATSDDGIHALSRHLTNASNKISSVYFSAVNHHLQRIKNLSHIYFILSTRYGILEARKLLYTRSHIYDIRGELIVCCF